MNLKKVNWLYVAIGAVVLYFIWNHFNKKPEPQGTYTPLPDKTQGDLFNERYSASGYPVCNCPRTDTRHGRIPRWLCRMKCNSDFRKETRN
jgi:hypothetical protein